MIFKPRNLYFYLVMKILTNNLLFNSFLFSLPSELEEAIISFSMVLMGHDQLLEICLLKKSARHNFSFARHHSSKCHFFCQLLENQKSSAVRVFRAVSLLDKKILTARIVFGQQKYGKCQLLDTIYSKENGIHVRQLG